MSSFEHSTDTLEDTISIDIILTTHGELSQQITAYGLRPSDSPHALQSRPMSIAELTLTPYVSSLNLNVIMFDETGKCSLVAQKFREGLRAAEAIYQDNKTLFVPEMLDAINHLHTSSETYISESDRPVREHTGLFQMYPNLKTIPEKKFTARSRRLEPTFAVFSNDERLTERITENIVQSEADGSLSLMQIILEIQRAIVKFVGKGKKVVINIIDMSCNDLGKHTNTKIAQTPRGSIQYKKIGGKKTKRKGSRRKKIKRRKTKRKN